MINGVRQGTPGRLTILGTLAVIFFQGSCGTTAQSAPPVPSAAAVLEQLPGAASSSRQADDAGRFLAGLPAREGSEFAELSTMDTWKLHRRELDRYWSNFEAGSGAAMRDFQSSELNDASFQKPVVFYPFSGPDALMVSLFFPHNSTYLMVGLEPPGTLPTAAGFRAKDLGATLGRSRESVYSVLHRSFFVTREMDHHFRGQAADGLLQPLLHLLVRSHHTVTGFRYVRVDEKGEAVERSADFPTNGAFPNRGVQVDFTSEGDPTPHRLFYFSVNLADNKLGENEPFRKFLRSFNGMATYFKATSYMTHRPEFSLIRRHVLDGSSSILQDDSGIPYRFLAGSPWRVHLFGGYERPYGSFRYLEQADLRRAYTTQSPKPLRFNIGYGFSRIPSNLQLAVR